MSADIQPGGRDTGDEPFEVLLIRVWLTGRGLRARLLRSGAGTGWVPATIAVTDDPAEIGRLVDAWLHDVSPD